MTAALAVMAWPADGRAADEARASFSRGRRTAARRASRKHGGPPGERMILSFRDEPVVLVKPGVRLLPWRRIRRASASTLHAPY